MDIEINARIYSVVVVRGNANLTTAEAIRQVGAYLYNHTTITSDTYHVEAGKVVLVLRTSTHTIVEWRPSGSVIDTIGGVALLAKTQCARLESGLYAARVIGSQAEAQEVAIGLA